MQPKMTLAKMTLHWSPRSPYVRKVMIVAHELGLADRIAPVRTVVGGTTPHRGLMARAPLGKIPVLELADGTVLYDSPVICDYLDSLHDGARLFPQAWPERGVALRRLALGDGMLDVALAWLSERFRPVERQSAPHMALWREKLIACVAALEAEALALGSPALDTGPFTIGHVAVGVALGYLDFRFAELAWRDGHPALAAWYAGFAQRESALASPQVDDR